MLHVLHILTLSAYFLDHIQFSAGDIQRNMNISSHMYIVNNLNNG